MPFRQTFDLMEQTLAAKQGSALALCVAQGGKIESIYLGQTAFPESGGAVAAIDKNSLFDLASLTKILCTMPLVIEALSARKLNLQEPVQKFFPAYPHHDTTIEHLLLHRSGLLAHEEFYRRPEAFAKGRIERADLVYWICASPSKSPSQAETVYSDLGILLLGFILEDIFGKNITELFETKIRAPLGLRNSGFRALAHAPSAMQAHSLVAEASRFVATAHCPVHQRLLQGEVDDNNAWALGGVAPHAGLFSTLEETLQLFQFSIQEAQKFHAIFFPDKNSRPPFTRGYMLYPGLRPIVTNEWQYSIGHTGFVGTSAWYNEAHDTSVILLGNRVHPSRADTRFIQSRLDIHAALWRELLF